METTRVGRRGMGKSWAAYANYCIHNWFQPTSGAIGQDRFHEYGTETVLVGISRHARYMTTFWAGDAALNMEFNTISATGAFTSSSLIILFLLWGRALARTGSCE